MFKKPVKTGLYRSLLELRKLSNTPLPEPEGKFKNLRSKVLAAAEKYENFIGLKDVKYAQEHVQQAENYFLASRVKERDVMRNLLQTREQLKNVREELSQVKYSSPTYLQLANKQHELVNTEEKLSHDLETAEDDERIAFTNLSNAMRESYEKERIRVENTKNWSLFGTIFGTLIGMFGSIYMNRVRTNDLLEVVTEKSNSVAENLETLVELLKTQEEDMLKNRTSLEEQMEKVSNELQIQNMRAMAGFVNSGEEGLSNPDKNPVFNPNILKNLQVEMNNYNEALNCLVKSVTALAETKSLTNNQTFSPDENGDVLQYLNAISDQVLSLYEICATNIQPTLSNVKLLLEKDPIFKQPSQPEKPAESISQTLDKTWNIKTILWFGTIFCAMYLVIKV